MTKVALQILWKKLNSCISTIGSYQGKKINLVSTYLKPHTKIKSKWMKHFNTSRDEFVVTSIWPFLL